MPAGGDKLDGKISAAKWNALTSLLQPQPQQTGWSSESDARDGIVTVQNLTGANLTTGSIVALRDPIWTPQENLTLFTQSLAFHGVVPTDGTNNTGGEPTTDYTGRFGVMLAPAAPGASGPALVSGGPVAAKVSLQAEGDAFADITHNSTTKLKSGSSGSAQILWPTTSTGSYPQDTWAIVRLGNRASAGGGVQMARFACSSAPTLTNTTIYLPFATGGTPPGVGHTELRNKFSISNGSTYNGELVVGETNLYRWDLAVTLSVNGTLASDIKVTVQTWKQDGGGGSYDAFLSAGIVTWFPAGATSSYAADRRIGSNLIRLIKNTRITIQAGMVNGSGSDLININSCALMLTALGDDPDYI